MLWKKPKRKTMKLLNEVSASGPLRALREERFQDVLSFPTVGAIPRPV